MMQVTNLSQIYITVSTEIVPNFFVDAIHQASQSELQKGDKCFIYDCDFMPTKAVCIDVLDDHAQIESANGILHKVLNKEPELNSHEFSRLMAAKLKVSEKRTGYDQHVINRALSANVIHASNTDEHEFTDHGKGLAMAFINKMKETKNSSLPFNH